MKILSFLVAITLFTVGCKTANEASNTESNASVSSASGPVGSQKYNCLSDGEMQPETYSISSRHLTVHHTKNVAENCTYVKTVTRRGQAYFDYSHCDLAGDPAEYLIPQGFLSGAGSGKVIVISNMEDGTYSLACNSSSSMAKASPSKLNPSCVKAIKKEYFNHWRQDGGSDNSPEVSIKFVDNTTYAVTVSGEETGEFDYTVKVSGGSNCTTSSWTSH